jgi:DNA-binding transcriptional MerR regulator
LPTSSRGTVSAVEYRIDELAQKAGTTSRNIRAHQARGLLPPPVLRGRTGWYGEEHLRRLELIDHLQERGFSLEAIRQTLDAWASGGDLTHLLGLHRVMTAPFSDEEPVRLPADELVTRFPEAAEDPALIERAVAEGVLAPDGDGGFAVPSPSLLDAGTELVRAGIPLGEILDLVGAVRADVADVASLFVEAVGRRLVDPITEGRVPAEQVAETTEVVRRLRPIALEVVRVFLAQELTRSIDAALADLAGRMEATADGEGEGEGHA